jgi:hypothetical protein
MGLNLNTCFCAIILFCSINGAAEGSDPEKPYYEVWELKSLKKINGHSVTVFGNPEIVRTKWGKAIKFDGVDDRLLIDNNPIGDAREFTVEVIFKPEPAYNISNAPRFIHIQDPDDSLSKRLMIELRITEKNEWYLDGYMQTDAGEKTLVNKTLIHSTGEWIHAAVTFKDNTFKTFVNGTQELSGNVPFNEKLINKTGMTSIGGRMNKINYYCGLIKTLKITRKALLPTDFIKLDTGMK